MVNKKEIYCGTDIKFYSEIIDILKTNGLKYKTKTIANDGAESSIFSFMFSSSRRARGSYGENSSYMKTYYKYLGSPK